MMNFSAWAREHGVQLGNADDYAVGMFFFPDDEIAVENICRIFDDLAASLQLRVIAWRDVPCHPELLGAGAVYRMQEGGMGSEDFASYTYDVPCGYLLLGAGTAQEDPAFGKPMHNECVVFNEDVLERGAALHAWCALRALSNEA